MPKKKKHKIIGKDENGKPIWDTPTGKHPGGHPRNSKAKNPETLWKYFKKYIKQCEEKSFETVYDDKGKPYLVTHPKYCPTLIEFAKFIGYETDSGLNALEMEYPEFQTIMNKIREEIQNFIVRASMYGKTNARFAQFILQCGYGMKKPLVPVSEQTINANVQSNNINTNINIPDIKELENLSEADLSKKISDMLLDKK